MRAMTETPDDTPPAGPGGSGEPATPIEYADPHDRAPS
jgi:hypothetical protein